MNVDLLKIGNFCIKSLCKKEHKQNSQMKDIKSCFIHALI